MGSKNALHAQGFTHSNEKAYYKFHLWSFLPKNRPQGPGMGRNSPGVAWYFNKCIILFIIKIQLMLRWTLIFLIIAIIAGALGFFGIAAGAASIAKVLFFIFIVLFLVSLLGRGRWGRTSDPL